MEKLFEAINNSYEHYEKDRILLEHSLEISNEELYIANKNTKNALTQEQKSKKIALQKNEEIEAKNKQLETTLQQLKDTQIQLVEFEKMASLGNLVAGVAHEINTPIGVGLIAASTLVSETKTANNAYTNKQLKGSGLKTYFENVVDGSKLILTNLERASKLIKSFKQVAVDQSNFVVKDYINEVLLSLKPHFKKNQYQITVDGMENITIDIAKIV